MYVEAVRNRNSPPAILLRESYREGGKVRKRTLCNLSDWPTAHIEGLRGVLKGGTVIAAERDAFTVIRTPAYRRRRVSRQALSMAGKCRSWAQRPATCTAV
jgi:hypothetical protein